MRGEVDESGDDRILVNVVDRGAVVGRVADEAVEVVGLPEAGLASPGSAAVPGRRA